MVTLFERPTEEVIAVVLDGHPDVHRALDASWRAAWETVDPDLLELCRLRIAMLLGCRAELAMRAPAARLDEALVDGLSRWPSDARFGPRERACLAFAEQWVIDVAGLDDATVGAVRDHLGEAGLVDFVRAVLVVEQRQRLRLIWQRLFEDAA